MGILINTGFDLGSSSPIDNRTVKNTTDERDALVTDGLVYENLKVYCKDTQTEYRWNGTEWETVCSSGSGGDLTDYQKKTDNTLDTTDKTIVGAINEVKLSIPTRTSELENNSNFITNDDLPTVPTKVSELTNDKNYISSIPSEYVTETELKAKGYLTSVPSTYALKTDIPTVPTMSFNSSTGKLSITLK